MTTPLQGYTRADGSPPQDGDELAYDIEIGPHYVPPATPAFDRAAGLIARDKAIARVSGNADGDWREAARSAVRAVAALRQEFTTDDVWMLLEKRGVVEPKENRGMGPIMQWATRQNICRPADKRPIISTKKANHGRPVTVYDSLVYGLTELDAR